MELFQRLVAPLVLKIGIHQGQAGRKAVRGVEDEGWSGGVESFSIVTEFTTSLDWAAVY
jgi:hypothetical protein